MNLSTIILSAFIAVAVTTAIVMSIRGSCYTVDPKKCPPPNCPVPKPCPPPNCPPPRCPVPKPCPECPRITIDEIKYTKQLAIPVDIPQTKYLNISFKLSTKDKEHNVLFYDRVGIAMSSDRRIVIRKPYGSYSENILESIFSIDEWSTIDLQISDTEWVLSVDGQTTRRAMAKRDVAMENWPNVKVVYVGSNGYSGTIKSLVINNKLIMI